MVVSGIITSVTEKNTFFFPKDEGVYLRKDIGMKIGSEISRIEERSLLPVLQGFSLSSNTWLRGMPLKRFATCTILPTYPISSSFSTILGKKRASRECAVSRNCWDSVGSPTRKASIVGEPGGKRKGNRGMESRLRPFELPGRKAHSRQIGKCDNFAIGDGWP